MTTTIVIITAFIGVAALVGSIAFMFRGEGASRAEDRLEILAGLTNTSISKESLANGVLSSPLDDRPNYLEEFLSRFFNVSLLLEQADSPLTLSRLFTICGALGFGSLLLLGFVGVPLGLVPLIAVALGLVPIVWLIFRRKMRLSKFAAQLPDALELMARALRAGHSLSAGFQLVSEEMLAPIGKEFGQVFEQQNLGMPLDDCLRDMTVRVPNLDLKFFATALILQRQTGGDLAEILDKIGNLTRERFKIWGQVQALTGEGRLSGVVLLALPPVLFIAVYRMNPDYMMILFTDDLGKQMLIGGILSQIVGALVIRKIVNIKV